MLYFALLFRDGTEFDEHKIVAVCGQPVSAVCALPPSDNEQLGLIAVASSSDHIIRIYRLNEPDPLYQLEGHTDAGIALSVVLFTFSCFIDLCCLDLCCLTVVSLLQAFV